jgi:hypothetical protein
MRTHIKVVAVVNIILGALGLLRALSVLLGGVFGSFFTGSATGFFASMFAGIVGSVIIGAFGLFAVIAGFGLLNHQQWARYVMIVTAIFSLFNPILGTVFAVYTLWVLFSDETKRLFATGTPYTTTL